jgi:putative ABC transport system ATP-binding protein
MSELGCCSTYPENDRDVYAELIGASKIFSSGNTRVVALRPADLALRKGELLLIIGPSGSGKTTLLSLLGCVLYPTEGCVCINGVDTSNLNDREMARLRLKEIGFVFQNFNLLSPLNSEENVMLPLWLRKTPKSELKEKVKRALELVDLMNRRESLPKQLSGGEQQRVAIARALVTDPAIILCDEPTASLDVKSMETVMNELRSLANTGKAVAVVTHDSRLKNYADKMITIENGIVKPSS